MKIMNTPASEINSRISGAQKQMQSSGINALLVVQRMDLFYFSGTAQNGYLYIPAEGEPLLMIKKYLPRAEAESPIKNIICIASVKELPGKIADIYGKLPESIGFEFDVMPVREFEYLKSILKIKNCRDGSGLIHACRMIKSDWEIENIRHCAVLAKRTFEYIEQELRAGISELEFAGMYETYSRSIGHQARLRMRDYQAEGYNWHILSGKSGGMVGLLDSPASGEGTSAAFPCGGGRKKIRKNEPIMIDIGIVFNGYHIDETRMFAIGSMPKKAMKASEAAIEIHGSIIEKAVPGTTAGELYEHSVDKAKALGFGDQYLGPEGYKVTFVGHGIGLEVVEHPVIARNRNDVLQPGMVFSIEPKLVFKDKFSAGIESVFAVGEKGSRLITMTPVKVIVKK